MNTRAHREFFRCARRFLCAAFLLACDGRGCSPKRISSDFALLTDASGAFQGTVVGVDCVGGVLRCEDGERFISESERLPPDSHRDCPWRSLGVCSNGRACVADGVTVVGDGSGADSEQLCAGPPRTVPLDDAPGELACEDGESFVCRGGSDAGPNVAPRVIDCAHRRTVARCARNCAFAALGDDAAELTHLAAAKLLCAD